MAPVHISEQNKIQPADNVYHTVAKQPRSIERSKLALAGEYSKSNNLPTRHCLLRYQKVNNNCN